MSSPSRPTASSSNSGHHGIPGAGRSADIPHSHHDDSQSTPSPSPTSDPSSSSPNSGSGSGSRLPSPSALLPPLGPPMPGLPNGKSNGKGNGNGDGNGNGGKPGGPIFANELLDPELHPHHGHHTTSKRHPVPEKCLTFCSQSQENQPICRMFCLRRRRPIATQEEQIARLRPTSASQSHRAYNQSNTQSISTAKSGGGAGADSSTNISGEGSILPGMTVSGWNPFKALERRMNPWSFIYVKGTPEGVVGRYMEELEGDDGNSDFGSISRNASELQRRKSPGGMEYIDWGEHGSLLHLPLTSLFAPLIRLPENISRVFAPSTNLLNLYRTSFTDGSQERNLARLGTELTNGGAFTFFGKLNTHYRKKIDERKAEIMKQREKLREETEKALVDQKDKLIREKMDKYEAVRKEQEE